MIKMRINCILYIIEQIQYIQTLNVVLKNYNEISMAVSLGQCPATKHGTLH